MDLLLQYIHFSGSALSNANTGYHLMLLWVGRENGLDDVGADVWLIFNLDFVVQVQNT